MNLLNGTAWYFEKLGCIKGKLESREKKYEYYVFKRTNSSSFKQA